MYVDIIIYTVAMYFWTTPWFTFHIYIYIYVNHDHFYVNKSDFIQIVIILHHLWIEPSFLLPDRHFTLSSSSLVIVDVFAHGSSWGGGGYWFAGHLYYIWDRYQNVYSYYSHPSSSYCNNACVRFPFKSLRAFHLLIYPCISCQYLGAMSNWSVSHANT